MIHRVRISYFTEALKPSTCVPEVGGQTIQKGQELQVVTHEAFTVDKISPRDWTLPRQLEKRRCNSWNSRMSLQEVIACYSTDAGFLVLSYFCSWLDASLCNSTPGRNNYVRPPASGLLSSSLSPKSLIRDSAQVARSPK